MSDETKTGRPKKETFDWPVAESKKQAAQYLGWPETRVTQCQKAGAPGFEHGRVRLGELIKWLGKRGLEDSEIDWARELKKEQAIEKRDARLVREGVLVSKPEIAEAAIKIQTHLFDTLEKQFGQELPPTLRGLDAQGIARECATAIDELREALRLKFLKLVKVSAPPAAYVPLPDNGDGSNLASGNIPSGDSAQA